MQMFLTAQLVFTIFMLATEKHEGSFIAPVGIGLSLFVAELMGVYYTGGSVNPARSFGPAVVDRSFSSYHWIYWVGPILGALLASAFYLFVKALEYETVNMEDPKAALGEKFNKANKSKEKHDRSASDHSSDDTYGKAPVLESGNERIVHEAGPTPRP
jgi:aquaporin related protein